VKNEKYTDVRYPQCEQVYTQVDTEVFLAQKRLF
jgi:hypothetical protein